MDFLPDKAPGSGFEGVLSVRRAGDIVLANAAGSAVLAGPIELAGLTWRRMLQPDQDGLAIRIEVRDAVVRLLGVDGVVAAEAQLRAARAHGREQLMGQLRDEDRDGVRRRFLDRLEQRVLHDLGHRVRLTDDRHHTLAGVGPQVHGLPDRRDLVEPDDLALAHRLDHVGMALGDLRRRHAGERGREQRGRLVDG